MEKVAFLFLTRNNTNQSLLWEQYFQNNHDKFNIYCHPKYPSQVSDTFLSNNIIPDIQETNHVKLYDAIIQLLKFALGDDKNNIYFILLSESCIPIKTFNKLYSFLFHDKDTKMSYIKKLPTNMEHSNIHIHMRQDGFYKNIEDVDNIVFHETQICISRHHLKKMLFNKKNEIKNIFVSNKSFMSSIFPDPLIQDLSITYSDRHKVDKIILIINNRLETLWKEETWNVKLFKKIQKLNKLKMKHIDKPKTFNSISKNQFRKIKKSNSFFARKFSTESNIKDFVLELL